MQSRLRVNLTIITILIIGCITMGIISYQDYSQVIKDDIENISKLTSTNIYTIIKNEITKPIFVSLTMANDYFLINWLKQEPNNKKDLISYLERLKNKYNYDSVFLVSNKTYNYYHHNKILKKISVQDSHDIWYFDLIKNEQAYELDVDTDQANNDTLTIFVNCKILDTDNNFLGVTGVGVKMNKVQNILKYFEDEFDLQALLVDKDGLVQVHTDDDKIESTNIFDYDEFTNLKDEIINNKDEMLSFEITENGIEGYLISRYIEELDWYLLIKKDTSVLQMIFLKQLLESCLILIVVIIVILYIITRIINKFGKKLIKIAETDHLTEVYNRWVFDNLLEQSIKKYKQGGNEFSTMLLDIDCFKKYNDNFGHILADEIIKQVAIIIKNNFEKPNIICRWGGDEFAGIIFENRDNALKLVEKLQSSIKNDEKLSKYNVTVSIGVTHCEKEDNITSIVKRADKGLYDSKENGRNQITEI